MHGGQPDFRRCVFSGSASVVRIFFMDKIFAVKTSGFCMRPVLKSGDIALIKKETNPTTGDAVLFRINGSVFIHRVLRRVKEPAREGFIIADDRGLTPPVFAPADSVIGVCCIFPSGKTGLVYSLISRFIFKIARRIKSIIFIG